MGVVSGSMGNGRSVFEKRPVSDFLFHELILIKSTEFGLFADTQSHEGNELADVLHDEQ